MMARRHYDLPSLTTLATFETAARHGSFKDSARELNVTPSAVSHQIKALEADLGTALFERRHRGVELTVQGELLFRILETSFVQISATLAQMRHAHRRRAVTIGATTAVSALWLTPRLMAFWREHGDIAVNQSVSDVFMARGRQVDLQIRYADLSAAPGTSQLLFRDELVPLSSPAFARRQGQANLEALALMPLIHSVSDEVNWTTWAQWFAQLGFTGRISSGFEVNNYTIALQAAREGAGVVLGWRRLVGAMVEDGSLVPLGDHVVSPAEAFYLVAAPDGFLSDNARTLQAWLLVHS